MPQRTTPELPRGPRRPAAPAAEAGTPWSWAASPWTSVAVGALAFIVYVLVAPPVAGDKDAGEFTLVLALNGVAHPTGYPIYTLLGHGFVRIAHALGAGWPRAANAWSAVGGGVAMAFFHALVVRLAALARAAPLGAAWIAAPVLLFGLDPVWSIETTLAEVYSWHVAWALGACLFLVSVVRSLPARGARAPDGRLLGRAAAWGALCGLGLAHHVTSVFVAAPLTAGLVVAVVRAGRWRWAFLWAALAASLVPLSSYGIIAWRAFHPAAVQWPVLAPTWAGVFAHLTGAQYRGLLGHYAPSAVQRVYLALCVYPYLALGLAALLALAARARGAEERLVLWTLSSAALLSTAYAFAYGASDPSSYFLAGMAIGVCAVGPLGAGLLAGWRLARPGRAAVALVLLLGVGAQLVPWMRTSLARREVYIHFDGLVRGMWASIPFTSGIIAWADDMYPRLREYQLLEGENPGLSVVNPALLTYPRPRRRFIEEQGFDPLAGIEERIDPRIGAWRSFAPGRDSLIRETKALILGNINRQTPLPVVEFLPESASVRLLRKPAESRPP